MRTLLLADPNPTIQKLVALTFAGHDFTVISVNDGEEAISAIAAGKPDVVLADVSMTKRSGYEVAAFVKQDPELARIPVLLLAGALDPIDEARARQSRCDGVVVKPFEPQQVVARVGELLQGGAGNPIQATPGVPRPIDRLMEPRPAPVPAVAVERQPAKGSQESPKVVKHPSAPQRPGGLVPAATKAAADDDPLGEYFDRLDVAFGTVDPPPSPVALADVPDHEREPLDVPTLTSVLGEFGRDPASPSPGTFSLKDDLPGRTPAFPGVVRTAESAFDALIAVDDEDRAARRGREHADAAASGSAASNEALVEAVAARVIEKLAPDAVADLVSRVVTEVAERLVREEIDRIRGRKP